MNEPARASARRIGSVVLCERAHRQHEPLPLAVLGHEADARRASPPRGAVERERRAARRSTVPVAPRIEAEERLRDLRSAGAHEPGEADAPRPRGRVNATSANLPGLDSSVDAQQLGAGLRVERAWGSTPRARGRSSAARATPRRAPAIGCVATWRPSRSTVTVSHRRKISSHPVADVDRRSRPRARRRPMQLVELLGLVLRQAARRLVEDDDARAAADGGGDLHHLLLRRPSARRPAGARRCGASIAAEHRSARRSHLAARRRTAARATAGRRGRGSRRPTGSRRSASSWCTMPMPAASASRGPPKRDRLRRSTRELARVGRVDARQDLAERALARAVLAAQRVARSGGDVEADVLSATHAREALADVPEADERTVQRDDSASACSLAASGTSSGTSVKPQSCSWRAQVPRLSFVTRTSSIGMISGTSFLKWTLSKILVHADVAPQVGRLREQHRRQPLLDVGQLGRQRVDGDDLHLLRIEVGEQRLREQRPAADHRPALDLADRRSARG